GVRLRGRAARRAGPDRRTRRLHSDRRRNRSGRHAEPLLRDSRARRAPRPGGVHSGARGEVGRVVPTRWYLDRPETVKRRASGGRQLLFTVGYRLPRSARLRSFWFDPSTGRTKTTASSVFASVYLDHRLELRVDWLPILG